MRYFTNNPLERLMMQKPKAARENSPPAAAKEHLAILIILEIVFHP